MDRKIIVGGCCRNISAHFPIVWSNIRRLQRQFIDSRCIFVESDSDDDTLELLKITNGQVLSLGALGMITPYRTVRLAICRNLVMQTALTIYEQDPSFRYLLVMDMDDIGSAYMDPEGLRSNFNTDDWTVMTASNPEHYYDIWALRDPNSINYDCWHRVEGEGEGGGHQSIQEHVTRYFREMAKPIDHPLIPVDSAFNGAAIYDLSRIKRHYMYLGWSNGRETCEHVSFHKNIIDDGGKIYINPRFVLEYGTPHDHLYSN